MKRIEGLDLARYLALIGMVFVNFDVVMVDPTLTSESGFAQFLQGKAAALFVFLAGIGFGLSANIKPCSSAFTLTLKKFIFLLIIGLLNSFIFQADIIHFYAFYFLIGVFLLPLSIRVLLSITLLLLILSVLMVMFLNYDQGWNWQTYHYQDYWTVTGFFRNLLFNGWHPVIPWLSFLLIGMVISKVNLMNKSIQLNMIVFGLLLFSTCQFLSFILSSHFIHSELNLLMTTSPIPPMPLYIISATGLAITITGACLWSEPWISNHPLFKAFKVTGKQTLTWYLGHIFLGMGLLEMLNKLANQTHQQAIFAAIVFCVIATVAAVLWNTKFKHGPLEALMKKVTTN